MFSVSHLIVYKALLWVLCQGSSSSVNMLNTVGKVMDNVKQLSLLRDIYESTEMKFKTEQSRDVTILMPINKAIQKSDLTEIVNFENLKPGLHQFQTVEGAHLKVEITPDREVVINGVARVVGPKHDTPMGTAYVVDAVLTPPDLIPAPDEHLDSRGRPAYLEAANKANNRYDESPKSVDESRLAELAKSKRPVETGKLGVLDVQPKASSPVESFRAENARSTSVKTAKAMNASQDQATSRQMSRQSAQLGGPQSPRESEGYKTSRSRSDAPAHFYRVGAKSGGTKEKDRGLRSESSRLRKGEKQLNSPAKPNPAAGSGNLLVAR